MSCVKMVRSERETLMSLIKASITGSRIGLFYTDKVSALDIYKGTSKRSRITCRL